MLKGTNTLAYLDEHKVISFIAQTPEVKGGVLENGDDEGVGLPADRRGVAVEQEPLDEGREQVLFQIFAHLCSRQKQFKFCSEKSVWPEDVSSCD